MHSAKTSLLFIRELKANGHLTWSLPQQPFQAFLEGTQWVSERQVCNFSTVRLHVPLAMCWLSPSRTTSSHKDQLPQGIHSELAGEPQH